MKILHVVTFESEDGAFGGPTRVAFAQAAALARLGHEVTVFAGSPKSEASDRMHEGFRLRTFPTIRLAARGGFATLWPRNLLGALIKQIRQTDIAHVHLARDLTTLPTALLLAARRVPYVTQSHGMIDGSTNPLAKLLDAVAVRTALAKSEAWLVLTEREGEDLREISSPHREVRLNNGIMPFADTPLAHRSNTVLFLARLHKRKRPLAFVEMAKLLDHELPDARFILVGPDEGEGPAVKAAIHEANMGHRLQWMGALAPSKTTAAMADARVYVLPSVNEVFPMSMLESFAAGTPTVATSSLGIADDCVRHGAALITDSSPEALARAVVRAHREDVAESLRSGARKYLAAELDIDAVARHLQDIYIDASGVAS